MGILKNGITGKMIGKVGNLVFYVINGKQVVRTVGKNTTAATLPQLSSRMEMQVINGVLKHIQAFIYIGFKLVAEGLNAQPYNMAISYNKKHAMQGTYPNIEIAYNKLLVSQGDLLPAIDPAVTMTPTGLNFTWNCPETLRWPRPTDQVMVLVYFPLINKAVYILSGNERLCCATTLSLSDNLLTEYMEIYISFIAESRNKIANSTYLGNFNKL